MKIKTIILAGALAASLTGCVVLDMDDMFGEKDPHISTVELQALQTREYEASEIEVFSAVIGAFQSNGYEILSSDRAAGLVIAKTASESDVNNFTGFSKTEYDKANAFVEKIAENRVSLRISIMKHVSANGNFMTGEKEAPRTKPDVYRVLFDKVQKSLFLKKNL